MSTFKKYQLENFQIDSVDWYSECWLVVAFGEAPNFDDEVDQVIDVAKICAAYRDFGETPEVLEFVSMATSFLGYKANVCLVFDEIDYSFELLNVAQEEASRHEAGLIVLT